MRTTQIILRCKLDRRFQCWKQNKQSEWIGIQIYHKPAGMVVHCIPLTIFVPWARLGDLFEGDTRGARGGGVLPKCKCHVLDCYDQCLGEEELVHFSIHPGCHQKAKRSSLSPTPLALCRTLAKLPLQMKSTPLRNWRSVSSIGPTGETNNCTTASISRAQLDTPCLSLAVAYTISVHIRLPLTPAIFWVRGSLIRKQDYLSFPARSTGPPIHQAERSCERKTTPTLQHDCRLRLLLLSYSLKPEPRFTAV